LTVDWWSKSRKFEIFKLELNRCHSRLPRSGRRT